MSRRSFLTPCFHTPTTFSLSHFYNQHLITSQSKNRIETLTVSPSSLFSLSNHKANNQRHQKKKHQTNQHHLHQPNNAAHRSRSHSPNPRHPIPSHRPRNKRLIGPLKIGSPAGRTQRTPNHRRSNPNHHENNPTGSRATCWQYQTKLTPIHKARSSEPHTSD